MPDGGELKDLEGMIVLKGCHGISCPYVGYMELDVQVCGKLLSKRGFLVVRDPEDPITKERKEEMPGLLGMNCIGICKELVDIILKFVGSSKMASCSEHVTTKRVHRRWIAKVAGTHPVRIPAESTVVIQATGPQEKHRYCAIVEPLENSGGTHLPANFHVGNTAVYAGRGTFPVSVANFGTEDIWLKPRTRIGIVSPVCIEESLEDYIQFKTINAQEEEIMIACPGVEEMESNIPSEKVFVPDLSKLDATEEEKIQIENMFKRHPNIFSKDDFDLGAT